jgi:hypothetical protein
MCQPGIPMGGLTPSSITEACLLHGLLPSGVIESPRKGHYVLVASLYYL